jgi:hypothetical protein
MKMARTNIEWVAQVSLLRPGCFGRVGLRGETQVSKSRPGPPTQSLNVAALFLTECGGGGENSVRGLFLGMISALQIPHCES